MQVHSFAAAMFCDDSQAVTCTYLAGDNNDLNHIDFIYDVHHDVNIHFVRENSTTGKTSQTVVSIIHSTALAAADLRPAVLQLLI